MRTQAEELAIRVMELLKLQRTYASGRNPRILAEIMRDEVAVRRLCESILHPEQVQPKLFEE